MNGTTNNVDSRVSEACQSHSVVNSSSNLPVSNFKIKTQTFISWEEIIEHEQITN